jgi:predicted nucleic acid-binding Zn ribbon protein
MRRSNEISLGDAIKEFLKEKNLGEKLKHISIINSWEKIMGKTIAKYTKKIFISKKKLYIMIESPALKNELSYAKDKILQLVNDEAGEKLIEEVIIQ